MSGPCSLLCCNQDVFCQSRYRLLTSDVAGSGPLEVSLPADTITRTAGYDSVVW